MTKMRYKIQIQHLEPKEKQSTLSLDQVKPNPANKLMFSWSHDTDTRISGQVCY